jgi:uracil-DNA glycosylase
MLPPVPSGWKTALSPAVAQPSFGELQTFLDHERQTHTVFPPEPEVYSALDLTPLKDVRVLILGQDPYHDVGQAHGLSFSVRESIAPPRSLVNIFRELHDDVGATIPNNGFLAPWATQGVLMLNAVLTVRAHEPNSHKARGWEPITDAIINAVNALPDRVVFVLWGAFAQKKKSLIDTTKHVIVQGAHPSPLSANKGFFGSKPFSQINQALAEKHRGTIDWQLPNI